MSTGLAPVRGALFELVIALLGVGVISAETPVSKPDAPFRLRWLSDLGAESTDTDRALSRPETSPVLARVPGAAYVLSIQDGSIFKRRRIAADYSMVYGLASAAQGDLVVAAEDGSITDWSGLLDDGPPSRRWRRELDERAVSVGWDGSDSVWVGTRQSRLIALSAVDGETRWSVDVGGRAEAPPLRVGDALFVATKSDRLLRLDRTTGKAKWEAELPGAVNHPPAAGGESLQLILVATWNGQLVAVRAETGEVIWSVDLGARVSGAPIATESFTVVATEDGAIRAYDLSGEALWTTEGVAGERTDLFVQESIGAATRLIVVSTSLTSLDASTGKVLDDYPAGAEKDIEQSFLDRMLEGKRPYSESEKASILERENFPIRGRLFGRAQLFGTDLVFGTEEGWVYWFDSLSVRPICRYRAGQRARDVPTWAPETLVAAASDAVFGVDPTSGDALWRRDVGPVTQIVAGGEVAVVGEDRIDVLDPRTGARRWSARGDYRAVASVKGGSWLAFGRGGDIQALDPAGAQIGSSLEPVDSIDTVVALGERSWAVGSRDGRLSAVALDDLGFLDGPIWEVDVEPSVDALYYSRARLIVAASDRLVGLSSHDGSSIWEIPLAEGETGMVRDQVFVCGEQALKLYDTSGGTLLKELAVESRAIGVALVEGAVIWLDSSGAAHRVTLEGDGEEERMDLGDRLSRASFENGSFLVTTNAGEIGLVEIVKPAETTVLQPQ